MRYHESIADEVASKNKADSFRGFLDDIPIYVMNFEGSGKNKYYTSAREAGKDFFDRDMTNASRSDSWVARNCLAGALGYDVDESGDINLRDEAYGHKWEVTFPESLPGEIIEAYKARKPNALTDQQDILHNQYFANAFSTYVQENIDAFDFATAAGQSILLPVKYQEVWAKGKDYIAKEKNSRKIEEVPYLDLQSALISLGFEKNKKLGAYVHDGIPEKGGEITLRAIRYAKALYDNKVEFVPDEKEIFASLAKANKYIDGKYDMYFAKVKVKTENFWGRRFDDDPEYVEISKYSTRRESRKR